MPLRKIKHHILKRKEIKKGLPKESVYLGLPIGTNLDRYLKITQDRVEKASGDFSQLLRDIALAGKIIYNEINRSELLDIHGEMGNENVQGEKQKKLDLIAHIRMVRALRNGMVTAGVISEEMENIIYLDDNSRYVVCMDPLDGSSNIDVNVSIGTIFSIYNRITPIGSKVKKEDFLQVGRKLVASGYVLYGSSSMLVFTTGEGVQGFTLDPNLGEFLLTHENMKTPVNGNIYSINDGLWNELSEDIKDVIEQYRKKGYTARYIGSLVADFHRNLLKGGLYMYPGLNKKPKGKLRLLYECNALAFLAEESGGLATDGSKNILDIDPKSFHERTPFFVGSKNMVSAFNEQ